MEISRFFKCLLKKSVITSTETDRGPGLFWTESLSQFCHITLGRNINSSKKIIWHKSLADVTIWEDFST